LATSLDYTLAVPYPGLRFLSEGGWGDFFFYPYNNEFYKPTTWLFENKENRGSLQFE
jgi:hypothetical protein